MRRNGKARCGGKYREEANERANNQMVAVSIHRSLSSSSCGTLVDGLLLLLLVMVHESRPLRARPEPALTAGGSYL